MKIQLRQAAVTDLNLRYTRHMGGNKYRQYVLPWIKMLASGMTGQDPKSHIASFIKKSEPDAEVEFVSVPQQDSIPYGDLTDIVLQGRTDIKKSLLKHKSKSLLYQRLVYSKFYHRFLEPIANIYNKLALKFNRWSEKMQGIDYGNANFFSMDYEAVLSDSFPKAKYQLPLMDFQPHRTVDPVHTLVVVCEEQDIEKGAQALLADLAILQKHKLIIGHLSMPSMTLIADTYGIGQTTVAMYCMLFTDGQKLLKVLNKGPLELSRLPLTELGVKYSAFEGAINYLEKHEPASYYDIETVMVDEFDEQNHQAYVDSYLASVPTVNAIAKKMSEALKKMKASV